jgi:single-stranded DNA-specific DHH superfamily exonuclease
MKKKQRNNNFLIKLFSKKFYGLIIHHWDTDGICSAAILLESIGEDMDTRIPKIGNYYLTTEEIADISDKGYEFIIVADMAIPKGNIHQLKRGSDAEIYIFDHHLQDIINIEGVNHYNPVSMGEPIERCPSTSWILSDYLNRGIDLLSILGAVGDNELKIKRNQYVFSKIERFLEESTLSFDDLLTMVELIDSNYKVGDQEKVLNAVRFIKENQSSPESILENNAWHQNLKNLEKEIAYQSSMPVSSSNGISIQEIHTKYNIISTLTRQLAWNNDSIIAIVINDGYFDTECQVYIRAGNPNISLKPVIDLARENGYSAGGKREVAGVVLPKEDTKNFVAEISDILKKS